ncbi:MAG: CBS domain-containing protein [Saccharolobus sp.]
MEVGSLISKKPVVAKPNLSIKDVAKIMKSENISSVIIVDDNERPLGIVTEKDIVRSVADDVPVDSPVSNIMTRGLITITPDKDVTEALLIMYQNNIRHLAVIENDGKLVGVLSIRDVAKALNIMTIDLSLW